MNALTDMCCTNEMVSAPKQKIICCSFLGGSIYGKAISKCLYTRAKSKCLSLCST